MCFSNVNLIEFFLELAVLQPGELMTKVYSVETISEEIFILFLLHENATFLMT